MRPICRYDPYARVLTHESYDNVGMLAVRRRAIERARSSSSWGIILGTLGRQGNPRILQSLQAAIEESGRNSTLVNSLPCRPCTKAGSKDA